MRYTAAHSNGDWYDGDWYDVHNNQPVGDDVKHPVCTSHSHLTPHPRLGTNKKNRQRRVRGNAKCPHCHHQPLAATSCSDNEDTNQAINKTTQQLHKIPVTTKQHNNATATQ